MITKKLYGGPGCGKTHRMLEYFEQELGHHEPEQIAFLTFTRAARQEAISRTGKTPQELPFVRTIHSLCYQQLGLSGLGVVTPADITRFGKRVGVRLTGSTAADLTEGRFHSHQPATGDLILQAGWHLAQHRQVGASQVLRRLPGALPKFASWLLESYRRWKDSEGLIDYTDLLLKYLELGEPLKANALFVDEAQDLSRLQWMVVRKMQANVLRRYLAGDDDQTIYEWSGASAAAFNEEPADEVEVLPQSVRLPRRVLSESQRIIHRVRNRYPKIFNPRDEDGEITWNARLATHQFTDTKTFLLYRNHYRGEALTRTLLTFDLPFTGLSPLDNPEVKAALTAFEAVKQGEDLSKDQYMALTRFGAPGWVNTSAHLLNQPKVSVLSATHGPPTTLAQSLPKLPEPHWLERGLKIHGLEKMLNPRIHAMSIHQSKGQQADTVIVDYELSRRTFEGTFTSADEEHRVFYVGLTRARRRLVTLLPDSHFFYQFLRR